MADTSAHVEAVKEVHNNIINILTNQSMKAGQKHESLAKHHADDYVLIGSFGETYTKDQYLELIRSGKLNYGSIETKNLNVRVFGETAIATGQTSGKATVDGQTGGGRFAFTSVYTKRGDGWKLTSGQVTMIDPRFSS